MSADELHRFLVEHQGEEDYTLLDSEKVVEKVLKERKRCQESVKVDQNREQEITLDELFRLLLHDDSNGPLIVSLVSRKCWVVLNCDHGYNFIAILDITQNCRRDCGSSNPKNLDLYSISKVKIICRTSPLRVSLLVLALF